MARDNVVRERSFDFAAAAIRLRRELNAQREFDLSRQMVRAATSVGANIEEALAGHSRRDFAARMTIASKEAREALYWLRLIREAELLPETSVNPMIAAADELVRLLTAIVKTSRRNEEGR